ncbi:MAG TPA: peptide-methionine (S)-S-oxide reductase MsrA [Polyangiaceae bacterium]|jgi:peptide-methionine (S)-S-oxide reductase
MRQVFMAVAVLVFAAGCHDSAANDQPAGRPPAAPEHTLSTPAAATSTVKVGTDPGHVGYGTPLSAEPGHELAAFAAGCFWGVEDAFRHVPGVTATAVGYTDGHTPNPTYERVCQHDTGYAETVLVEFDPKRVSYDRLLDIFFEIHDPTTLNRQGPDDGDQYRSAIFTNATAQDRAAHAALGRAQKKQTDKIVTEIAPLKTFYKAEDYHQQYAERTGTHGCPIRQFSSEGSASL